MNGKVFGIGYSQTGTTSFYAALARPGYRSGAFRHRQRIGLKRWVPADFTPNYLTDFDAVTDLPIGRYFRELDARYPGSTADDEQPCSRTSASSRSTQCVLRRSETAEIHR